MIRVRFSVRTLMLIVTVVASFFGGLETRRRMFDALKADLSSAQAEAASALLKRNRAEMLLHSVELELELVKAQNRALEGAGNARRMQSSHNK